jgi:hypothetical protein
MSTVFLTIAALLLIPGLPAFVVMVWKSADQESHNRGPRFQRAMRPTLPSPAVFGSITRGGRTFAEMIAGPGHGTCLTKPQLGNLIDRGLLALDDSPGLAWNTREEPLVSLLDGEAEYAAASRNAHLH